MSGEISKGRLQERDTACSSFESLSAKMASDVNCYTICNMLIKYYLDKITGIKTCYCTKYITLKCCFILLNDKIYQNNANNEDTC